MKPLPYSREEREQLENAIVIHPVAVIVFSVVVALLLTGIAVIANIL